MALQLRADLTFTVDVPPHAGRGAHPTRCSGRVRAEGSQVEVHLSPMPSLGGSATRPLVRPLAQQLDDLGLTVQVEGPDGPLVRLGSGVRAPWWQQLVTRSSRIHLVSVRALTRSIGGPRIFEVALPPAAVLPAVFDRQRRPRRRVEVALRQGLRRLTGHRR
ncbi:hypothetical protein [uncultured Friedmanniella sp.]|uniref:hypothetical protein n=1 Tax=uncultured Friedmanniella sp. TaxID=335381 RepID=UPI0035CB43ED